MSDTPPQQPQPAPVPSGSAAPQGPIQPPAPQVPQQPMTPPGSAEPVHTQPVPAPPQPHEQTQTPIPPPTPQAPQQPAGTPSAPGNAPFAAPQPQSFPALDDEPDPVPAGIPDFLSAASSEPQQVDDGLDTPLGVPETIRPQGADQWVSETKSKVSTVKAEETEGLSEQSKRMIEFIEKALHDDRVTQIDGYSPGKMSVQFQGSNRLVENMAFSSEEEYIAWMKGVVDHSQSVISWDKIEEDRMGVLELPGGERFCIFLPPLARNYPTFSLRKHTAVQWAPTRFVELGTLDDRMLGFLQRCVAAHVNILFVGQMGSGKALSVDAPVLTPSGWHEIGSLEVGDPVIGSDGESHKVIGVFPQGEKELFKVTFTDGSSVECCDDHLWQVQKPYDKGAGKGPKVLPLKEIRNHLVDGAGNRQYFIPLMKPLQLPEKKLPLDPYLLGLLLGDGGMTRHPVTFASVDAELIEAVEQLTPGDLKPAYRGRCDYIITSPKTGVSPNLLSEELKEMDLLGKYSYEKHIPDEYLWAGADQRLALLQGLCDTDGSVAGVACEFTTTAPKLADDVIHLAQSLGGTARKVARKTTYTHKGEQRTGRTSYRINIRLPEGMCPFRLKRKRDKIRAAVKYQPRRAIMSVEPAGRKEAVCIAVDAPDSLYVTKDFIVTHNTSLLRALTQSSVGDNEKLAIVEQVPELSINKPLVTEYVYQPTVEGLGLGEVLDFNLYNGLSRLIVGEVHLEGITKMLETMILTEGSMSTYHAFSTEQAGERMKLALQIENANVSGVTAVSFLRQAIELVVVLEKVNDVRRVMQISEVDWRSSSGKEQLSGSDLFHFDPDAGRFRANGREPDEKGRVRAKLAKYNVPVPQEWFFDKEHLERFTRNPNY